jgi:hypothetical protein
MRKLLNKPWFAAVLAVAAIALVGMQFLPNGHKFKIRGLASSEESIDSAVAADAQPQDTAWSRINKIQVPANLRDPFAVKIKINEIVEKAPEPDVVDTVHLSAIWLQDGHALALINDHICEAGDQIGRMKLESASQDGIWLSHWRGRNFVKLGGDFTLNTPAKQLARALGSL